MMTVVEVALRSRLLVRAGWAAVGAGSLVVAAVGWWIGAASMASNQRAASVSIGLALLYTPAALAGIRMAGASRPRLVIADRTIAIHHPGVLREPITGELDGFVADTRTDNDRRVAATVRRKAFGGTDLLDGSIPVVSAAPSSHSDHGTAQVPNLVLFFREPVPSPAVSLGVRLLLRVSTGRTGRYRGPRPRGTIQAVRLVADDPAAAAVALSGSVAELDHPRNASYLRPITSRDRTKARRHRVALAWVTVAILLIVVVAAIVRAV